MYRKAIAHILASLVAIGFIVLYGTVGALELDTIDYTRFYTQSIIGVAIILVGGVGFKIGGYTENEVRNWN